MPGNFGFAGCVVLGGGAVVLRGVRVMFGRLLISKALKANLRQN
jgi:hypothetical protein